MLLHNFSAPSSIMLVYIYLIMVLLYAVLLQMQPTTIIVAGLLLVFISYNILIVILPPICSCSPFCAENSFWCISKVQLHANAFQQAFESYVKTGQETKVEIAVKTLGDWPDTIYEQKTYQSNL